jgi:hypothetical protein
MINFLLNAVKLTRKEQIVLITKVLKLMQKYVELLTFTKKN